LFVCHSFNDALFMLFFVRFITIKAAVKQREFMYQREAPFIVISAVGRAKKHERKLHVRVEESFVISSYRETH
jgi:hypothetical protein